jgi:hypothetical protein
METKNNKDTNNNRDNINNWDTITSRDQNSSRGVTISWMPLGSDMPATPVTAETECSLVIAKMSFRYLNNISNSRSASSNRDVCNNRETSETD